MSAHTETTYENKKTGTVSLCFGAASEPEAAQAPEAKPAGDAGKVPNNGLQPAGDPNPSTRAPLPTAPALALVYSEDPQLNAILKAVAAAGGNPDTFLAQMQAQSPNPPDEDVEEIKPEDAAEAQKQRDAKREEAAEEFRQAELAALQNAPADAVKKINDAALAAKRFAEEAREVAQEKVKEVAPSPDELFAELVGVVGTGPAKALRANGIASLAAAQSAPPEQLEAINGVAEGTIKKIQESKQAQGE